MPRSFISEPLTPLESSFDPAMMARGEPGLPHKFLWRKQEWEIVELLGSWKEHGDCAHGSGERYVRKHGHRVRTTDGTIFEIYFLRSFGRGRFRTKGRWSIYSMEQSLPGKNTMSPRSQVALGNALAEAISLPIPICPS
jgi:phosphoribosylglycinamide formyltransferase-1